MASEDSQDTWRAVRGRLNRTRGVLTRTAAQLYPREVRTGDAFLAPPQWLPEAPIPLKDVSLQWDGTPQQAPRAAVVTGAEPQAEGVLPVRADGRRFERYTAAIAALAPPTLFEDRPSYRLLDAELSSTGAQMTFTRTTYFAKLDLAEALAHELAQAACDPEVVPDWTQLPLRSLVADPFDLHRRTVAPDVQTLTLRRSRTKDGGDGGATFVLHWRDPARVATNGGVYGVVPTGEFQPSTDAAWDQTNDFDLWRGIVREYAEEVLGEPERDQSTGSPLDYEGWELHRTLQEARADGGLEVYCLGVGMDPLTLAASVLTVAVFDPDVFDTVFADAVQNNAEGTLVTASPSARISNGLPFTEATIHRLLAQESMTAPGACLLQQAWQHRDPILP